MVALLRFLPLLTIAPGSTLGSALYPLKAETTNVSRIVGGHDAPPGEGHYVVALIDARYDQFFCTGSLLSLFSVMSAGHCCYNMTSSMINIQMGSHHLDDKSAKIYEVKQIIIHGDFDRWSLDNDLCILILAKKVKLSKTIEIVKLDNTTHIGAKVPLTAWGFGLTRYPDTFTDVLQKVTLTSIDEPTCKRNEGVDGTRICTESPKGIGTCSGDSGGPLMSANGQVGVASDGEPCALGIPDLFMRVSSYSSWINKHAKWS